MPKQKITCTPLHTMAWVWNARVSRIYCIYRYIVFLSTEVNCRSERVNYINTWIFIGFCFFMIPLSAGHETESSIVRWHQIWQYHLDPGSLPVPIDPPELCFGSQQGRHGCYHGNHAKRAQIPRGHTEREPRNSTLGTGVLIMTYLACNEYCWTLEWLKTKVVLILRWS